MLLKKKGISKEIVSLIGNVFIKENVSLKEGNVLIKENVSLIKRLNCLINVHLSTGFKTNKINIHNGKSSSLN